MTVKELIDKLRVLPPDATVYLADWNEAYAAPDELTHVLYDETTNTIRLDIPG